MSKKESDSGGIASPFFTYTSVKHRQQREAFAVRPPSSTEGKRGMEWCRQK